LPFADEQKKENKFSLNARISLKCLSPTELKAVIYFPPHLKGHGGEACQIILTSYCACYQYKLFPRVTQPSRRQNGPQPSHTHINKISI